MGYEVSRLFQEGKGGSGPDRMGASESGEEEGEEVVVDLVDRYDPSGLALFEVRRYVEVGRLVEIMDSRSILMVYTCQ